MRKNTPIKYFWSQISAFLSFCKILQLDKFEGVDFKYENITSSPKILKSSIFGPKFKDFYFYTKLCNKTNSRTLISNVKMVFQNCCPKDPNKALLVPNLRILIFAGNLPIRQFGGRWLEIQQQFVNIPAKDRNRAFMVPNLFIFSFWMKLCSFTNSSVLIKHLIIVFVKLQPKSYLSKEFLLPSLNFFGFRMKLCRLTNAKILISNSTLVFWISAQNTQLQQFWSQI